MAVNETRPLELKRDAMGQLGLHDAETGQPLTGQMEVQVIQQPRDATRVVVTFLADAGRSSVKIDVNDYP